MAEKKAESKAENVTTETVDEAFLKELVPFYAFKDEGKYSEDIFVSVGDHRFQIQRGVEVMVPRYVKEALDNADKQRIAAANYSEAQAQAYRASARNFAY